MHSFLHNYIHSLCAVFILFQLLLYHKHFPRGAFFANMNIASYTSIMFHTRIVAWII